MGILPMNRGTPRCRPVLRTNQHERSDPSTGWKPVLQQIAALLICSLPVVAQAQAVWTGATSNSWSVGSNWSNGNAPDLVSENASIATGFPTIDANLTIGALNLSGGQIQGTASTSLMVGGVFSWTGGTIGSSANIAVTGPASLKGALNNAGSLQISNPSIVTDVSTTLNNSGTISIDNGKFTLYKGASSGRFDILSGGTIEIAGGGYTFSSGASLGGNGTFVIGSTATLLSGTSLSVEHLILSGSVIGGSLNINGASQWTGGEMKGGGSTSIGATASIILSASANLDNRILTNSGTLVWGAAGTWRVQNGAILSNSGLLEITADANMMSDLLIPASGQLINTGTLRKSAGTGSTSINIPISGGGTIQVSSGELVFGGGGAPTGTIVIDSGATLRFASGSAHPMDISGAVALGSAGALVNAGYLRTSANLISGQHLIMDVVTAGELNIIGDLNVASFTWNRGVISGPGTTRNDGEIIFGAPGLFFGVGGGRTLENAGTISWNAGSWGLGGVDVISVFDNFTPGRIHNLIGATLNIDFSTSLGLSANRDVLILDNGGILNIAPAANVSILGAVNNDGTVNVQDGATLSLNAGGTSNGASLIGNDATLMLSGDATHTLNASARIDSAGLSSSNHTFLLDAATTDFGGAISPTVDARVGANEGSTPVVNFQSSAAVNARSFTLTAGTVNLSSGASISGGATQIGVQDGSPAFLRIPSGAIFTAASYLQQHSGFLSLEGGKLKAVSVTVQRGFIMGAGTIEAPRVNVSSGTVLPGQDLGIGSLHIDGDLTLDPDSSVGIDIDATNHTSDRIISSGSVDLGGESGASLYVMVLGDAGGISASESFSIVKAAAGRIGKFKIDLPNHVFAYNEQYDHVGQFEVQYASDEVILRNFVPEPNVAGVGVLMALGLLRRPRHRAGALP
jgi:hypothetical protein